MSSTVSRVRSLPRPSFHDLPGARSVRLVERHVHAYRHAWLVFVSGIAEPMFYLLSVGVGIGGLVGTVAGAGTPCRTASSSLLACSRSPR
jgi:lipooligosaccharide transport system permease protein